MGDMINTSADRLFVPGIIDVEHQRNISGQRRMQGRWRTPCTVAHPCHILSSYGRSREGHRQPMTGDHVTIGVKISDFHFYPLYRRIDEARSAATAALFTEHMPGLDTQPELQGHILH